MGQNLPVLLQLQNGSGTLEEHHLSDVLRDQDECQPPTGGPPEILWERQ